MSRAGLTTAGLVALVAITGLAGALISNANVGNQFVEDEELSRVHVFNATLERGQIEHTSIHDSRVSDYTVSQATLRWTYLNNVSLDRVRLENSRGENIALRDSTLVDTTLCETECRLLSGQISDGFEDVEVFARLVGDAPAQATPNMSYDIVVQDASAGNLRVENDPSGVTALGFDNRAANEAIESLELWVGGEQMATFGMGESMELPSEDFTLRVNVASTGIVDGSTLGLVLDLDGRGLRPALTTLQVEATQLAFAPLEGQAFAPFLADNVARLVISVPSDENGNVDRDLDIVYTVNVLNVDAPDGVAVTGDLQHHSFLHGDSELFSDEPIKYSNPTSMAAHHPATLEFILRDTVGIEGITYGAAPFYATHLVAQSPYATTVAVSATTTTEQGTFLDGGTIELELGALPEEPRSATTPFGPLGEPMFPGTGILEVRFVDESGTPVGAQDNWVLMVQETPQSHQTEIHLSLAGEGDSFRLPLAASEPVGLPFGDFVPHEYLVCLHRGADQMECANDGDLVPIDNGATTSVEIRVA